MGDLRYWDFVPDGINPANLSRDFLITIRLFYVNFINILTQLIAYINLVLFVKLETLSKEQLSQKNITKWTQYNMRITPEVYSKLQHFVPIKNIKGQSKAFRLTKNGISTGVFQEIPEYFENVLDEEKILSLENQNVKNNNNNNNSNLIVPNDNIENRIEEQNDGGESDGLMQKFLMKMILMEIK